MQADSRINPTSMTVDETARLLSLAGGRPIEVSVILSHVDRGATVSVEGKINLLHYVAWLVQEASYGE